MCHGLSENFRNAQTSSKITKLHHHALYDPLAIWGYTPMAIMAIPKRIRWERVSELLQIRNLPHTGLGVQLVDLLPWGYVVRYDVPVNTILVSYW